MNNSVKFSVIMPCYNSAAYVKNALDSIINQTYPNWELIAVNDGSKDETPDILYAYAKEDNRIKVVEKENGGYATAINFGLDHISGDYFLMLGSDDRLETSLFQNLCEELNKIDFLPDCFAFRAIITSPSGETKTDPLTNFQTVIAEEATSFKEFCDKHASNAKIFSCRDTARCYKRSVLGELRYFGRYGCDADGIFSMLFCHKATSFACFPVNGYLWQQRANSVSASISSIKLLDMIGNWRLFFQTLLTLPIGQITKTEKYYFLGFYNRIVSFSVPWKLALKHASLLRSSAKVIKKCALAFGEVNTSLKPIKLIAFCPFLYALSCKLKRMFQKA